MSSAWSKSVIDILQLFERAEQVRKDYNSLYSLVARMTLVESLLLASAPQEGPTKVDGTRKLEEIPCVALLGPPEIRTGALTLQRGCRRLGST